MSEPTPSIPMNGVSRRTGATCPGKPRTRGELEAAIARSFIQLEKSYMGRGPLETRAFLLDDMVVVRLRGVLTPAEHRLAEAEHRGAYLIKQSRLELMKVKRPEIEAIIQDLLGVGVRSLHTDISTRTGERVVVLSLDQRPTIPDEEEPMKE